MKTEEMNESEREDWFAKNQKLIRSSVRMLIVAELVTLPVSTGVTDFL